MASPTTPGLNDAYIQGQISLAGQGTGQAGSGPTTTTTRGLHLAPGSDNPMQVYMGRSPAPVPAYTGKQLPDTGALPGATERVSTVDQAMAEFDRMSPAAQRKWANLLVQQGVFQPGAFSYMDLQQAWQDSVQQAS